MSETTQDISQDLNQTLEKTELGHIINENKKGVITAGIIILLAIIAFSFYQYQKNNSLQEKLQDTFTFQKEAVTPYLEGKITEEELMTKFQGLDSSILEAQAFLPLALKISDKMAANEKKEEVVKFLKAYYEKLSTSTFAHYLLAVNYAAHLEDASQNKEAITVLEDAMKAKFETLKDKVYFDLGRLYLASGNKEKATEMFEYVNKNFADSEFAKLAKLYMAGMNK